MPIAEKAAVVLAPPFAASTIDLDSFCNPWASWSLSVFESLAVADRFARPSTVAPVRWLRISSPAAASIAPSTLVFSSSKPSATARTSPRPFRVPMAVLNPLSMRFAASSAGFRTESISAKNWATLALISTTSEPSEAAMSVLHSEHHPLDQLRLLFRVRIEQRRRLLLHVEQHVVGRLPRVGRRGERIVSGH